jgi:hypothetical protein
MTIHDHTHGEINISVHDGALIGSFTKDSESPFEKLEEFMCKQMKDLSIALTAEGALIGYIKAAIKGADETVVLSITKSTVNTKRIVYQTDGGVSISLTVILFNIERERLEQWLRKLYQKIK